MLSMSFTLNIVNIHRTILHVLALRLRRGRNLVYFTRTPQKMEQRGEGRRKKRWRRSPTSDRARPVESSASVAFFFQIHGSYGAFRYVFSMSRGTKGANHAPCWTLRPEPVVQHRQMSIKGKTKSLSFVFRSSFRLEPQEASRSQQGFVGRARSPEDTSSYVDSEEERKRIPRSAVFAGQAESQCSSLFQCLPGGGGGLVSLGGSNGRPRHGKDK